MPERSPATATTSTTQPQENARASSYLGATVTMKCAAPAVPARAHTYYRETAAEPFVLTRNLASSDACLGCRLTCGHEARDSAELETSYLEVGNRSAIGSTLVPSVLRS